MSLEANAAQWCHALSSSASPEGAGAGVRVDWACADRNGGVYHCTSDMVPGTNVVTLEGLAEQAGRRAQQCTSRTFPPYTLKCTDPRPDNTASCRPYRPSPYLPATDLECVVFPDTRPPGSPESNVYGKPMHCASVSPPPFQRALDQCAEGVRAARAAAGDAAVAPPGTGRHLTTLPSSLADRVVTVRNLCASTAPGTVMEAVFLDDDPDGEDEASNQPDAEVLPGDQALLGDPEPPEQLAEPAQQVSALQAVVDGLQPPLQGGAQIPPVPFVVISDQLPARAAPREPGQAPFITLAPEDTGGGRLSHEYGHVLGMTLGFGAGFGIDVSWQVRGLHEGFADSFALLSSSRVGTQPFEVWGREKAAVKLGEVAAAQTPHHNGVPLLNVVQRLRATYTAPGGAGAPTDVALQQLLVDTAADPRANDGYAGFRAAALDAAKALGMPVDLVTEAFDLQGWGEDDRPPETCSAAGLGGGGSAGPGSGGPGRGGPGGGAAGSALVGGAC